MKDGKPWLPDDIDFNGLSPQTPGVEGDRIETADTYRVRRFSPFSPVNPCEGDQEMVKESNPKEFFGNQKLHLDVVPGCVEQYCSLALLEGALKYGRYNWRIKGARISTYISAAKRHLDKYVEGQWADPKTQVPHLASVLACVAIILDAGLMGTLRDDRPPSLPNHDQWIDAQTSVVAHLQELFKNHDPRQYVIGDTVLSPNAEATCPRQ